MRKNLKIIKDEGTNVCNKTTLGDASLAIASVLGSAKAQARSNEGLTKVQPCPWSVFDFSWI